MNPLLQAIIDGAPPGQPVGASPLAGKPGGQAVQKLNYSHEAMIDLIIACPGITQDEIASRFDYTASWISTVMATELFKSKLAERREQLVDPEVRASIKVQFEGLLARSMEVLRHKLNATPDKIPDQLAVQVAKMSGQALGYGNKEQKVSVSETHLHLHELGNNLVDLLRQRKSEAGGRTLDGIPEQRTDTPRLSHDRPEQEPWRQQAIAAGDPARSSPEPGGQVAEPQLRSQASG